jgi:hypothetical protein
VRKAEQEPAPAPSARTGSPRYAGSLQPDQVRALAGRIGNRAMGALLQRYTVDPMPTIHRQFLMWRSEAKILDLNCGWYSQLAAVDHFYVRDIRAHLTDRQRARLERGSAPHLSYAAGRDLLPYKNTFLFTDFGFDPGSDERSAIGTPIGLPPSGELAQLRQWWETRLQMHGPLIVSGPYGEPFGVAHFVTVVGIDGGRMHYLDALSFSFTGPGARRSAPLAEMSAKVDSIRYVDPRTVRRLFQRYLPEPERAETGDPIMMVRET